MVPFHHRAGVQPSGRLVLGTGSERITPPTLLTSSSPFEPETASTVPFAAYTAVLSLTPRVSSLSSWPARL